MHPLTRRIVSREKLNRIVARARGRNKKIAWTNGCFDLVHAGHVRYLESAKALADLLLVGVNSDHSIAALKSSARPLQAEEHRLLLVAAIRFVDYVLLFDETSPWQILNEIKPDYFVKGDDYSLQTIDQREREAVESYNGRIVFLPGVEGLSTTALLQKIIDRNR